MRRKNKTNIDMVPLRFPGGSEMICGDDNIYYVCCALIAGIKAIEQVPLRKRSFFQNHILYEWQRILEREKDWMQKVEDFNK